MMVEFQLADLMSDELQAVWRRYLDRAQSFRPLLHAYCHRLAGDLWDAEDLSQETLICGFHAMAAAIRFPTENPQVPAQDPGAGPTPCNFGR